ncbi:MAG: hypothetical protein KAG66_07255, partial [Methylococcales bacterium]|nr:hypothetical protein [Methylococcales bacterium]
MRTRLQVFNTAYNSISISYSGLVFDLVNTLNLQVNVTVDQATDITTKDSTGAIQVIPVGAGTTT